MEKPVQLHRRHLQAMRAWAAENLHSQTSEASQSNISTISPSDADVRAANRILGTKQECVVDVCSLKGITVDSYSLASFP